MVRNFYFFRHGQTNENAEGAREGNRTDAYLTSDGGCVHNCVLWG